MWEFRGIFKEVLWMIQESFRAVLMKLSMCFKKVSRGLQKKFLVWKFQGCVEINSRVFQENFEGASGVFLRVFEAFSREFPEGFK